MRSKTGEYRICPVCKIKYYVKKSQLLIYKVCSIKCQGITKRGIIPANIKIAQANSPIKKGNKLASCNFGEKHWNWQRNDPSYKAIHDWLRKKYGNANKCENKKCIYPRKCARGKLMIKPKQYQWANTSGQYKRDIKNFVQLCASCHKLFDLGKIVLE